MRTRLFDALLSRPSGPTSLVENSLPNVESSNQIRATLTVRQSGVILWDEQPQRRARIRQVIQALGARVIEILDLQRDISSCACCAAALGIGCEPDGAGLRALGDLKRHGIEIVAYGDGTESWSVKLKCLSLLAGARQLLDSSGANFQRQFTEALAHILSAEANKRKEAQQIRSVMREIGMVGSSAAIMHVFRCVLRFSTLSDLPVLISGETGTGKEGLARALHCLDPKRSRGPFVAVNCGAIATPLAESELFGHRRGAFTGADRDRKGLIRSAEGGVLFLDEIGELDAALQAKLLRVLQEGRVLGVGEDRDTKVDVRVLAATNRDLEQLGHQSKFRVDLFHRLNVLSIKVPPLRDRLDDLEPLTEHFLEKYRSLCSVGRPDIGRDFFDALRQVSLPGTCGSWKISSVRRSSKGAPRPPWASPISLWKPGSNCRKLASLRRRRSRKAQALAIRMHVPSRIMFASCWTRTAGISPVPWRIARGKQSQRPCGGREATKVNRRASLGLHHGVFTTRCANIELRPEVESDPMTTPLLVGSKASSRNGNHLRSHMANVKKCSGNLR